MIINNVNPSKLLGEFWDNGIVDTYHNLKKDTLVVEFTSIVDMDLVQSIIDAHDPTPIPPSPTKQEVFEQQITANTDYLLDVDFRLILVELGMF